nr:MAG TPA: hypothetical protein [Ackermannviridae sp.]
MQNNILKFLGFVLYLLRKLMNITFSSVQELKLKMIMNMTKAEIIKSNIENVNNKYNTSFEVNILDHKNYDTVLVTKEDDSCFTIKDIISILHNSNLNDWKISLNYGDEGGDYPGYTYLDEIRRKNGYMILDGDSEEYDDNVMTGSSLREMFLINGMKDELVYINNMDGGGDYGTNRRMTYIEIYVNKIGTSNRVNLG